MSDGVDQLINKIVDDIWNTYDQDNSGALDREETRRFMENTLKEMSEGGAGSEAISDEDFDATFKEFDKDGSGTIEKAEMAAFIKKVSGIQ